jgi:hypothetical protein
VYELEALVGHLYIAGKRTINTTPPGALVCVAPRQAARGREADLLLVLVSPSGQLAPTSFYEQMADLLAERYFASAGSVTAGLRDALDDMNRNLYEHNQAGGRLYEANLVGAVLRGSDLTLARVGAALALVRAEGITQTFPANLADDEALFQPPLGVNPAAGIQMLQVPVTAGARLALSDVNLAEVPEDRLRNALGATGVGAMVDHIRNSVLSQVQVVAVEFIAAHSRPGVAAAAGESSRDLAREIMLIRARNQGQAPEKRPLDDLPRQARSGLGTAAHTAAHTLETTGRVVRGAVPRGNDVTRYLASRAVALAVVAVPLFIVLLVGLGWIGALPQTSFEQCLTDTVDAAVTARSLEDRDRQTILNAWTGTLQVAERCHELRPDDFQINAILREGQDKLDALNSIRRREATPLAAFPGSSLGRLLLQGLDLYVLDEALNVVWRVQPGNPPRTDSLINMRGGAVVDGYTVGRIVDIAFDREDNRIVALDDQGVLVRCQPQIINQCEAQQLLASDNWEQPIAISLWQRRLYVLDTGTGQIWRYEPSGSNYNSGPTEYFSGGVRPPLANAVDFAISNAGTTNGEVFILFSDGVVLNFFNGSPQPFSFSGFPANLSLLSAGADSLTLNDSPILPALFVVSRATRTIYETTLAGTYVDAYRIYDEAAFTGLSHVAVDPAAGVINASAGTAIYRLDKRE